MSAIGTVGDRSYMIRKTPIGWLKQIWAQRPGVCAITGRTFKRNDLICYDPKTKRCVLLNFDEDGWYIEFDS